MTRRPPAIAECLLEWIDAGNYALQGDLREEFGRGRSRAWYWRQVGAAAGVAATRPVRAHGVAGLEPFVLGITMLVLLGFYVVFVINVTDWLLRFEGVNVLSRVPKVLERWPAASPLLALGAGFLAGRVIGAGGDHHRVARIVAFGATTMLCAVTALQAVAAGMPSFFMPHLYQQVGTTTAFVAGLIGSVGATMMMRPRRLPLALVAAGALLLPSTSAAQTEAPHAKPVDPVTAIVDAFRDHEIVALCDAHGIVQSQNFLKVLIRDPRFAAVANDIVVEFGNARYQDLIDRFVRGETVDERSLRAVWQNTTVANEIPVDETFFQTVRAVNATLPPERRLRVLLGDPPIDWATVKTRQDHFTWLAMRDTYPAALVQLEVLARRRRALLVYGHMHFQRRQIMSNFDMDDWRAQTIVSLIERSSATRMFTVWQFDDQLAATQADVPSWPAPSIAPVRGTRIGAADVSLLIPSRVRVAMRADVSVPIPEKEWRRLRVEEQMDAVLYLGPKGTMTASQPSGRSCAEPGYLDERLRRIALTGMPAFEADRARALCAGRK